MRDVLKEHVCFLHRYRSTFMSEQIDELLFINRYFSFADWFWTDKILDFILTIEKRRNSKVLHNLQFVLDK